MTLDHAALLSKARQLCGCYACTPVDKSAPAGSCAMLAVYEHLVIEADRERDDRDTETAGLLADVCDAAFGDGRAERHGYAGVVERVQLLVAVARRAIALRRCEPGGNHHEHAEAELWNALSVLERADARRTA